LVQLLLEFVAYAPLMCLVASLHFHNLHATLLLRLHPKRQPLVWLPGCWLLLLLRLRLRCQLLLLCNQLGC
jgi:hypothetical protein